MKKHKLYVGGDITFQDSDVFMNDVKVDESILSSSLDISKRLIYMDKIPPKNVVIKSRYPIVAYFTKLDRYKIPKYIKDSFVIRYVDYEVNIFKILSAVCYNSNRDAVYKLLITTKPPIILLHKWILCNAYRLWCEIPEELLKLDTYVMKAKTEMIYKYIAYTLPIADMRVQFRWMK